MKIKITNRHSLSAAIIFFYLIPLLFFSSMSIHQMSPSKSWGLLSLGLLLMVGGTLILMLLIIQWEQSVRKRKHDFAVFSQTPQALAYISEREAKVTSLDPTLSIENNYQYEPKDFIEIKESSKELNLLQTALKSSYDQLEEASRALEDKREELQKKEGERRELELKVQQTIQDFADYKLFSEEQLKQKNIQSTTLQQIIEDQRSEMEKRQDLIHHLDTKVHDLSYEIKTLLYLHEEDQGTSALTSSVIKEETPHLFLNRAAIDKAPLEKTQDILSSSTEILKNNDGIPFNSVENPVRSSLEAANLLKKCINIAQKLTGSNYYSNESSRYREFSSSYFAIDQRRLFEGLRSESGALVIVYSPKEGKVLFVNNESKSILGWNPEKFVIGFNSIMQEGANEWKKAINSITVNSDSQTRFLAKTMQGQEVLLNCHLGIIPTGLFRNYIIGILYPT